MLNLVELIGFYLSSLELFHTINLRFGEGLKIGVSMFGFLFICQAKIEARNVQPGLTK